MTLTLILGATRSGKSAHAERLAAELAGTGTGTGPGAKASTGAEASTGGRASAGAVRYVGTADPGDDSMAERLSLHRERRPAEWETVEAGDDLAAAVATDAVTLIDGLGGWIAGRDRATVTDGIAQLIAVATAPSLQVIVVAEHAGEGLLPMDRIARDWLDLLGESVQRLSAVAARAQLVIAGRVLELPPV